MHWPSGPICSPAQQLWPISRPSVGLAQPAHVLPRSKNTCLQPAHLLETRSATGVEREPIFENISEARPLESSCSKRWDAMKIMAARESISPSIFAVDVQRSPVASPALTTTTDLGPQSTAER